MFTPNEATFAADEDSVNYMLDQCMLSDFKIMLTTPKEKKTVSQLRLQLNERDQESLLWDLDIGHIPKIKRENSVNIVNVLSTKLGIILEEHDFFFAERVKAPDSRSSANNQEALAVEAEVFTT
ncbi:unnamed protein product [Leptidea sinapis]|uniref:Uncharacterized protein n=1 Tax=Leptidea sinapis TaxID=189913 RepID=A0A5E4PQ24_9NEOP|nr:unnamed protein product [Leptidea sinapis]